MGQGKQNNALLGCDFSNTRDALPSLSPSLSRQSKSGTTVPEGWRGLPKSHVPLPTHPCRACYALGWKLTNLTTSAVPKCPRQAGHSTVASENCRPAGPHTVPLAPQTGRYLTALGMQSEHLTPSAQDCPTTTTRVMPSSTPLLFLSVLIASSPTGKAAKKQDPIWTPSWALSWSRGLEHSGDPLRYWQKPEHMHPVMGQDPWSFIISLSFLQPWGMHLPRTEGDTTEAMRSLPPT